MKNTSWHHLIAAIAAVVMALSLLGTSPLGSARLTAQAAELDPGPFTELKILEGSADGEEVVDLLDPTSANGNWKLETDTDYYISATVNIANRKDLTHLKVRVGNANESFNGTAYFNVPGGMTEEGELTSDYFNSVVQRKDFADIKYGFSAKGVEGSSTREVLDGIFVYDFKPSLTEVKYISAIRIPDDLYDGKSAIEDAVSLSVGSWNDSSFTAAHEISLDLKLSGKAPLRDFIIASATMSADLDAPSTLLAVYPFYTSGTNNAAILYDNFSVDLTLPEHAEIAQLSTNNSVGSTVKYSDNFGRLSITEPVVQGNGTKTVTISYENGMKATGKNVTFYISFIFPSAEFTYREKPQVNFTNPRMKVKGSDTVIALNDISGGKGMKEFTLLDPNADITTVSARNATEVFNLTGTLGEGNYMSFFGGAKFSSVSQTATPYAKTYEANYNITNAMANISHVTVPLGGLIADPVIRWEGLDAAGNTKSGELKPAEMSIDTLKKYTSRSDGLIYRDSNAYSTYLLLPAKDFGIVSFTKISADIGKLRGGFDSSTGKDWTVVKNASGAFGYFTSDEPGIQVQNTFRLYNTDPAQRNRENGDLRVTTTLAATLDYRSAITTSGSSNSITLDGVEKSQIPADSTIVISATYLPVSSPLDVKAANTTGYGNNPYISNPQLYLFLPAGMSYETEGMTFHLKRRNFRGTLIDNPAIDYKIENVSYLNTTGDGVKIYRISFPDVAGIGFFDQNAQQSELQYSIPLYASRTLPTTRYEIKDLIAFTSADQITMLPSATGANAFNWVMPDKYGVNGGKNYNGGFRESLGSDKSGFGIQELSVLGLNLAVTATEIGGTPVPPEWYTYDATDPNSTALLGLSSKGSLRLNINNSDAEIGNVQIALPLPKAGKNPGKAFSPDAFAFDMNIACPESAFTAAGFAYQYIKLNAPIAAWTAALTPGDYTVVSAAEADAVLLTKASMGRKETHTFLFDFSVEGDAPGLTNIWNGVCAYQVASGLTLAESPRVASTIAGSSVTGYVFNDLNRSGVMDSDETGVSGVSVVLKESGGRIVSTTTDAEGYYEFLTVRESEVTVTFSVQESSTLRFNMPASSGTGLVSTVTPDASGLGAAKTFSVMLAEEKVHAALSGFYTLSYVENNLTGTTDPVTGLLPENGEYVYGEIATVKRKPDNLLKKGYEFKGWNTESNGSGTMYQAGETIPMSGNVTLYAIWEKGSYTISFNYRGATGGNTEQSRRLLHRSQYQAALNDSGVAVNRPLPAPTRTGYTFVAWRTSPTSTTGSVLGASPFNLGVDTTLYAHWSPKTSFAIRYDANGGSAVPDRTGVSWEDRLLPTEGSTRPGYTFGRWVYEGSGGAETAITGKQTYGGLVGDDGITSITLKAEWTPKTDYKVSYNTNGGTPSTITPKENLSWDSANLLGGVPALTRKGYTFVEWLCGSKTITAASTYGELASTDTVKALTFQARWTPKSYTIHYDANNGLNETIQSKTVSYDAAGLLPGAPPVNAGHAFNGWYYGETKVTEETALAALLPADDKSAITLIARWDASSYTVKYEVGSGVAPIDDKVVAWAASGLIPAADPTWPGHRFDGWLLKDSQTPVTADSTYSGLVANDTVLTITLEAQWVETQYTVGYSAGGGSFSTAPASKTLLWADDGLLRDISEPSRSGYDFDGWYYADTEVDNSTTIAELIPADDKTEITLTARWTEKSFVITYAYNNDEQDGSATVLWTGKVLPETDPEKAAFVFIGWYYNGQKVVIKTSTYGDLVGDDTGTGITLTARWADETYTVRYVYHNGSDADSAEVLWGESVVPTQSPVYLGHSFDGWHCNGVLVADDVTYAVLAEDDTTVAELTLEAQWSEKTGYKIIYDTGGGSAIADRTGVAWSDTVWPAGAPSRTGYDFTGWQLNGVAVVAGDTYGGLTGGDDALMEMTLIAQWTQSNPNNNGNTGDSSGGNGGKNNDNSNTANQAGSDDALVIVDGKEIDAGQVTVDEEKSEAVTVVDQELLEEQLETAADNVTVIVPELAGMVSSAAELVVKNLEDMAQKDITLTVQVGNVTYELPTAAVDTAAICESLTIDEPSLAPVTISITTTVDEATQAAAENAIVSFEGEMVLPPMQFTMTVSYEGKTLEVSEFSRYVSRSVEIPEEQAGRITTVVVLEADGAVRHVPTYVFAQNGKWYVRINSLTNSTYVPIYNAQSFTDAVGKWYEAAVSEMGSRKVLEGVSEGLFEGERSITRAEFAAVVIRALGLSGKSGDSVFSDVASDSWYVGAVNTAYAYRIIAGRDGGLFDPAANVTREEAMAMIARAASVAGYDGASSGLHDFADADAVSAWAEESAQFNVGSGLIVGDKGMLHPQDDISRAEAATIVLRLLRQAELVDIRG